MEIKTVAVLGAGAVGSYIIWGLDKKVKLGVIGEGERAKRLQKGCLINDQMYYPEVWSPTEAHGVDLLIVSLKYCALKDVLKSMEGLRNEKLIKSNMETKVTLSLKDEYKDIANLKDDLKQLFIVAKVELVDDTTLEEYETSYIKVEKFNGVQCPRCWNYFDEDEMNGELCSRCASVAHRVAE